MKLKHGLTHMANSKNTTEVKEAIYRYHLVVTRHQYSQVCLDIEAHNDEAARMKAVEMATGVEFPEFKVDRNGMYFSPYSEAEYSVDWAPNGRKRISRKKKDS